jgi:hypothetical protein
MPSSLSSLAALALLSAAAASAAPPPAALADTGTALRCAAAFGIVASEQSRGTASALAWPDLRVRGKEFFVQLGARMMDEERLDRAAMQARYKAAVDKLQSESIAAPDPAAVVRAVMEPCLGLLDATVPAVAGRSQ